MFRISKKNETKEKIQIGNQDGANNKSKNCM